jgi:hypothetical protein
MAIQGRFDFLFQARYIPFILWLFARAVLFGKLNCFEEIREAGENPARSRHCELSQEPCRSFLA